ncbi:MAG TPA: hypothetical protein PKE27_07995 [Povalibacter sp.]|uniref:hypothetical protein n=1 Tax=Povalibacter sp. TaxID=1962978 RepID=UPI002CF07CB3|nr:hypothetical protein [Povalibacter sp.]HMN44497.1 hypothetical protein [Povalibacter sp.]
MSAGRSLCLLALTIGSIACVAHAADPQATNLATTIASADSAADQSFGKARPRLDVTAGKDEKRAVISFGHVSTAGLQWQAKVSSPWDDDESQGQPATLDGLANSAKLEVSLSSVVFSLPDTLNASELKAACEAARADVGETAAECDERLYDRVTSRLVRRQIADAYFGKRTVPLLMWSINGAVGVEDFKTLNLDASENRHRETQTSAGFDVGGLWPGSLASVILGYRWQNAMQNARDTQATVCVPIEGSTAEKCKQGFLGRPVDADKSLVSLEFRKQVGDSIAFTVKYTRDFESDVNGIDVPIYLIKSSENAFSAGIRLGWTDDPQQDDDVTASIFVSTDFSLMP